MRAGGDSVHPGGNSEPDRVLDAALVLLRIRSIFELYVSIHPTHPQVICTHHMRCRLATAFTMDDDGKHMASTVLLL